MKTRSAHFSFILFIVLFLVSTSLKAINFTVTNVNDSGTGSLREAFTYAKATTGADIIIDFAIPGAGPYKILLQSDLPVLNNATGNITIDGSTQVSSGVGSGIDQRIIFDGYGIQVRGGAVKAIINNITIQNVTTSMWGIIIEPSPTQTSHGCIISNCTIDNSARGIILSSTSGNILSGNVLTRIANPGIVVIGDDNLIISNRIGIDLLNNAKYNTNGPGISISGKRNIVGLKNKANIIANNKNGGVEALGIQTQNQIMYNVIYNNDNPSGPLAISSTTKTAPVITSKTGSNNLLTLLGTSQAGDTIQIFSSKFSSQNANEYVGQTITNATGNWSFDITLPSAYYNNGIGQFVATATDIANGTSSLSNQFGSTPCIVTTVSDNGDNINPIPGSLREAVNCVNSKTEVGEIAFAIPGAGPYVIALSGPPLVITNSYGFAINANSQVLSGVGSGTDQSVTVQAGTFIVSNAGPSSFTNLTFSNSPFGIRAFSDSITIENNKFISSSAVVLLNPSTDSNKVVISGNSFSNPGFGVDIQNVNNLRIENNSFTGVNFGAIRAQGSSQINIISNQIANLPAANGINIQSCTTVTVSNNTINGGNIGLFMPSVVYGSARNNTITNIAYGIQYSTVQFSMVGNSIDTYSTLGISPYTAGALITSNIIGNTIVNGSSGTTAMVINISDGNITDNIINQCAIGIDIANNQGGAVNTIISGNSITSFSSVGMDLGQSTNLTIYNNFIGNGTGSGIQIPRSHSNIKIVSNFIGVTSSLVSAPISGIGINMIMQNGFSGALISHNTIGHINMGPVTAAGSGIYYTYSPLSNVKIDNNYIGIDSLTGSHPIANRAIYLLMLNGGFSLSLTNNRFGYVNTGVFSEDSEELLIKKNTFSYVVYPLDIRASASGQAFSNKISQNDFILCPSIQVILLNGTATPGNNGKSMPILSDYYSGQVGYMMANGSGAAPGDTVEIYYARGMSYRNILYITFAVADASGNWKAPVPYSLFYMNNTTQFDPTGFLLANTTDISGNTSELNYIYPLKLSLCTHPSANNLPLTISICSGQPAVLDGFIPGGASYSWYDNQSNQLVASTPTFTTSTAGKYRLDITDGNNCTASDTTTVLAKTLPTGAEFLMASEAGIGDEVLIIDISLMDKNSLVWDFSGATVTPQNYGYSIVFSALGYHEVKVTTEKDGCTTTTSHFINIGTESKAGDDGKVYPYIIKDVNAVPNPNNGIFNLVISLTQAKSVTIETLNFMGMLVNTQTIPAGLLDVTQSMDLSSLSTGTYILRIICDNDSRVIRVSKDN